MKSELNVRLNQEIPGMVSAGYTKADIGDHVATLQQKKGLAQLRSALVSVDTVTMMRLRQQVQEIAQRYQQFSLWGPELVGGRIRIQVYTPRSFTDNDWIDTVWLSKPADCSGDW